MDTEQARLTRLVIIGKIVAGRRDIEAGRVVPNDQVIAELLAKIAETNNALSDDNDKADDED